MRAILQLEQQDINEQLLQTIKQLLAQNSEILLQPVVKLEAFDSSQSVAEVMQALSSENYSAEFLNDIEKGLKTSTVYAKNED